MGKIRSSIFDTINYHPWKSQKEGHESNARFKSLFAGARYGKSIWAARDVICDILKPNTRGWIVGPTYDQPSKEFRYIYQDIVLTMGFRPVKELNVRFSSPGPQILIFPWGSEVYTKSEDNPDSLLGDELDWLILSEGSRIKESTYEYYLRPRLGSRMGRVLIPTTPKGFNWLYKKFYQPFLDGHCDYWSSIASVLENENFSRKEYEDAKRELSEDVFAEQYDGKFIPYSGLIYRRFNQSVHVVKPFNVPDSWTKYMAIDPHPQTPCAILWVAVDHHGALWLYDEMFIPNLTIPEIAQRIASHEDGAEISRRVIDPNAKYIDKMRRQITSVQMQLRQEGISCTEANNKFESAYYKICELLTEKSVFGADENKKPRLFVFSGLKETIHEFLTCTWENEKDNHMLDCLKYIVNENPVRTWTKEDREEVMEEEREVISSMDSITGY